MADFKARWVRRKLVTGTPPYGGQHASRGLVVGIKPFGADRFRVAVFVGQHAAIDDLDA